MVGNGLSGSAAFSVIFSGGSDAFSKKRLSLICNILIGKSVKQSFRLLLVDLKTTDFFVVFMFDAM